MLGHWRYSAWMMLGCVCLLGCGDIEFGRSGGPIGNEAQTAADAAASLDSPADPAAPAPAANPEAANAEAMDSPSEPAEESGTHVGKTTKEVLDANKLKDDPDWKVAASDASEVKAFTAAGTAYNRAAALSGTANLDKWLKMQHALHGKYPSYEEVIDYMAQYPSNMPALREYQHYGYDETTGEMVILENQKEKQARRNELGIE